MKILSLLLCLMGLVSCQNAQKISKKSPRQVGSGEVARGKADLDLEVPADAFDSRQLALSGLTFDLTYLGYRKSGALSFVNGMAVLELLKMPEGISADLTVEFLSAGKAVLVAEEPLKLAAGKNTHRLSVFFSPDQKDRGSADGTSKGSEWDGLELKGSQLFKLKPAD